MPRIVMGRPQTSWAGPGLASALLLAGLLLWTVGCNRSTNTCTSAENCPADDTCLANQCVPRMCRSSADCQLEQFCDLSNGQCTDGCAQDSDCAFGQSCASGVCNDKPCQNTALDCDAGEFCDAVTGTCFKAAAPYCAPCQSSADCGGGDNTCRYIAGDGPYCLVTCSEDQPCPAGYDCIPLKYDSDIVSYNCATLCQYLEQLPDGSEPTLARRPPSSQWPSLISPPLCAPPRGGRL